MSMMMMMRDTTKIPIMIARMPMKITDEETAAEEGNEFYPCGQMITMMTMTRNKQNIT